MSRKNPTPPSEVPEPQDEAQSKPEPLTTVSMVRSTDTNPPPYTADVHPDEVENWRAHGWRPAH